VTASPFAVVFFASRLLEHLSLRPIDLLSQKQRGVIGEKVTRRSTEEFRRRRRERREKAAKPTSPEHACSLDPPGRRPHSRHRRGVLEGHPIDAEERTLEEEERMKRERRKRRKKEKRERWSFQVADSSSRKKLVDTPPKGPDSRREPSLAWQESKVDV